MNANRYEVAPDEVVLRGRSGMQEREMKILFIGNSGVGKTSLVHRVRKNEFLDGPHKPTESFTPGLLEAEFQGKTYHVELHDTVGEERHNSIFPNFYRGANGAIVVYDVTNYRSYEKIEFWMKKVLAHIGIGDNEADNFPFLLLGNKSDFDHQQYPHIDGSTVAEDLRMSGFIKTSAKSGEGIGDAIKMMVRLIAARYSDQELQRPRNNRVTLDCGNNDRPGCILKRIRRPGRRPRV